MRPRRSRSCNAAATKLSSQLPDGTVERRNASENADPHTDTLVRMALYWRAVRSTPVQAPVESTKPAHEECDELGACRIDARL